jgi:sulfoxide reductase heme-binding subunit YedZ
MNPVDHSFWLASRATGIVALVLLSLSVAGGMSMSSKLAKRGPGSIGRAKQAHEALSLVALSAILAHGLLLLGDDYLKPTISQIFIPFTMPDQPIWTGIGIIGAWVAAVCGLSYYARRWIGVNRWKVVHRFTLVAWLLSFGHAIGSGSDAGTVWFLALMGILLIPVVFSLIYRLLPAEDCGPKAA